MGSTARNLPRRRSWPRVLVLLLAVLVPTAPAAVSAPPSVATAETAEYDAPDAPRPTRATARRAVDPRPRPAPAAAVRPGRALPLPPRPPHRPALLDLRRTVVLRC
ncbi:MULTISPECIES: hypothetical protein [Streptomyces]|uniref:Secreted protein n=1 Tax=Streptomyces galilaeus TaxID=33899 RepID=A0ABW9IC43_STRGJ|nr:hypothetical protein [Streptomyces galilaeus]QEU66859.1 hypothetical protein CP966_17575 [Streptomyces galilaeus]GGW67809.1 hypothetical protein GCM10010350_60650 [Streptomyces galilaeus]